VDGILGRAPYNATPSAPVARPPPEQELHTAENGAVASLERASQAALSQVHSAASQQILGIDTLARAIASQQPSGSARTFR